MLNNHEGRPTVKLSDLVPDRCNFKDEAFRRFVRTFMDSRMPGFSMHLISTNHERWELEEEGEVVSVECEVVQEQDGLQWRVNEGGDIGQACLDDLNERIPLGELGYEYEAGHVVDLFVVVDGGYPLDYDAVHEDEGDAEDRLDTWRSESRYGFPWAWNWCWQPDDFITTEELQAAGFTVATYVGGEGNWREDMTFRLCGIDGGGYSFEGAHFARIAAIVAARCGWIIDTDNGQAYIEVD